MGLKFEAFFYFNKQGRRIEIDKLPPLRKSEPAQPTKDGNMVIFSAVKLKELFEKSVIIHGKSRRNAHVVTVFGYGDMVLPILFLMDTNSPCCLNCIAVRIVVVSSGCGPKGILSAFKLR